MDVDAPVNDAADQDPAHRPRGDPSKRRKRVIVWKAFAAVAQSVPPIRAWTRGQLGRRGIGAEQIDDMELMVSEAASNAVRHADGSDIVVILETDGHVEAAVHDADPARPRPRQAAPSDTSGRGLSLIHALSDAWGVRRAPTGKWVWFRIDHPD